MKRDIRMSEEQIIDLINMLSDKNSETAEEMVGMLKDALDFGSDVLNDFTA